MSIGRAYQVSIGVLMCVSGMWAAANENQIETVEPGHMRAQVGYPPLQQTMPSPTSNPDPRAENLPPMYPAEPTDATGDYPPIGYEPETVKPTARSPQRRAGGVQHSGPAQFSQRPPARRPQVPQPYSSQDLNVWSPTIGSFPGPAAPPPPTAPSEYPSPPASGASNAPGEIPIGAPSERRQPTTGEYPPLADETSSGYPYSRGPQSAAPRAAQPYRGGPPPLGYGAYRPGPHGPYPPPPPPYYGGPPYPGRW